MPLDPAKIRSRMDRLGYSVTATAERAGIDRPVLSKYLAGIDINVKLDRAERLAAALRCSVSAITSPKPVAAHATGSSAAAAASRSSVG